MNLDRGREIPTLSRAALFRHQSHAWYTRDASVDEDRPRVPDGRGVHMPQKMFAAELARRIHCSERHALRLLDELERRTEEIDPCIVMRDGARRYIDRDSLYRLQKLIKYDLLLDPHHSAIVEPDGRLGPKAASRISELRRLKDDQAKDDRPKPVDVSVSVAMAVLLGWSERDMKRGERIDEDDYDALRDICHAP
jgi:hypothetical protein